MKPINFNSAGECALSLTENQIWYRFDFQNITQSTTLNSRNFSIFYILKKSVQANLPSLPSGYKSNNCWRTKDNICEYHCRGSLG